MTSFKGLKYIKSAIQGLTILATLSFVSTALAANTATSVTKSKAPSTQTSQWKFNFGLETASNLMKEDAYEREAQTSFEAAAIYKFNRITSFKFSTAFSKDHTGPQDAGFENSSLGLSFLAPINDRLDWANAISAILPTNRKLQDETSFQGTALLSSQLIIKKLVFDSYLLTGFNVSRNFHEYDINADGIYNVRNQAGLVLGYTLPLFANLTLETLYKYQYAWLYNDDTRSKFAFSADLSWAFTSDFSVYVGTSNEGSALKPNGVDSNIQIFSDTSSIVKAGLNLSI